MTGPLKSGWHWTFISKSYNIYVFGNILTVFLSKSSNILPCLTFYRAVQNCECSLFDVTQIWVKEEKTMLGTYGKPGAVKISFIKLAQNSAKGL